MVAEYMLEYTMFHGNNDDMMNMPCPTLLSRAIQEYHFKISQLCICGQLMTMNSTTKMFKIPLTC